MTPNTNRRNDLSILHFFLQTYILISGKVALLGIFIPGTLSLVQCPCLGTWRLSQVFHRRYIFIEYYSHFSLPFDKV